MHTDITEGEKLSGKLSLTFRKNKTFLEFCEKNFNNFNPDQHEPVAIRLFHGMETIVTLYALDKVRQEGTNYDQQKIPVKKFKSITLTLIDILPYVMEFNFTISEGNYDIEDMEVINK
ncbi:MAG: hypothetical protein H0W61_08495 [Bacteroidetes bacterium]|nr:hypothetical protein [Bacteroidota bacterium]